MFPFERGIRGPQLGVRAPPAALPGPAGPVASSKSKSVGPPLDSVGGVNSGFMEVTRVRTKFPETWLWTETSTGYGTGQCWQYDLL